MRQIDGSHDPNGSLPDFNPTIDLPPGARPFTIAIDARDKYAYITDRNSYGGNGLIYVLDIDPISATFHQVVEHIRKVGWALPSMFILIGFLPFLFMHVLCFCYQKAFV
jgi:hypothetical protein